MKLISCPVKGVWYKIFPIIRVKNQIYITCLKDEVLNHYTNSLSLFRSVSSSFFRQLHPHTHPQPFHPHPPTLTFSPDLFFLPLPTPPDMPRSTHPIPLSDRHPTTPYWLSIGTGMLFLFVTFILLKRF